MNRLKSQSAMEYLMTYGWAILIVAVVLGALFELGIFSGTTFGGNACIPASGYLCNNPVLSTNGLLSVSFGEVGYQITITGVSCSTNSTAPSSFQSADILMESGQIENLNFSCPLPSDQLDTPFSGYLFIEYNTLNYPTQVVRFATVATKALLSGAPSAASSSISNVPITLSNAEGVPTPAPFQQMISFNPSSYSSYESADLGNIRFYQGSTELYSWCESGCASSSSSAIFWVKLPSGIAANSNTIINMNFESVGTNYDGIFAGAEPQESTTYAQYDNGANVFTFYDNFAGNALSSNWIASLGPGSVLQVSNSITLIPPSGTASSFVYTKSDYGQGVVDFYTLMQAPTGSSNYCASYIGLMTNSLTYNNLAALGSCEYYGDFVGLFSSTSIGASSYVDAGSAFTVLAPYSVLIPSNTPTSISAQVNYGSTVTITTDMPTLQQPIMITEQANGKPIKIIWIRFRAYPPNGVMPTVTLGALS